MLRWNILDVLYLFCPTTTKNELFIVYILMWKLDEDCRSTILESCVVIVP